jgi:penicillin-binding protein 2
VQQEFEKRLNAFNLTVVFLIIALIGRLAYVQLIQGSYYAVRAANNSSRELIIDAPRGDILTSDGLLLVTSRPAYVVSLMVPSDLQQIDHVIPALADLLADYGVTEESIRQQISETTRGHYRPIRLAVDVDEDTVLAIDERRMDLPGVLVERQAVRHYPQGELAAYLIGGLGKITPNNSAAYRQAGYRLDATVGIFGLENAYELVDAAISLRGIDGYRQVEVDSLNRLIADVGEVPAVAGNKMTLTIDADLQRTAEQAIAEIVERLNDNNSRYPQKPDRAAAVVLNVKTGEILAWASYPSFNPGSWATSDYLWTSNIPLNAYPVGSTFKPITLLAGMMGGVLEPDETFYCTGSYRVGNTRKNCWSSSGHGHLTLEEGIKVSCNVVFYTIAQRLVSEYGRAGAMDRIGEAAELLQLDEALDLDFVPGYLSAPGNIPTSENFQRIYGTIPYPGEVWDASIGQGIVEFTPLQMAMYASLLANGGQRYQPYVVKQIESPEGEITFRASPQLLDVVDLDPVALEVIRNGMHEVTLPQSRPGGPGNGSAWYQFTTDPVLRNGEKVEVALKTGTAEIGDRRTPHSWAISFAPFEDPEVALATFVAHGRSGAAGAVPVAHAILKAYFAGEQAAAVPSR